MNNVTLKWKPSDEGYTETHCGRYFITPEFWGRCNATAYSLKAKDGTRIGSHDTQRQAKAYAQQKEDEMERRNTGRPARTS